MKIAITKLFSSKKDGSLEKKKKSKPVHHPTGDGSSVTVATEISGATSSVERRKHKKSKKNKSKAHKTTPRSIAIAIPEVVEEYQTPNEKVIASFLAAWNNHCSKEETLAFFASTDALVKFEDNPDMPIGLFVEEVDKVFKSFPDITFQYESIKEDRPGLILVDEINVSATHRGEPYAFGPFPPVPTTNKHIVNDPERFWFKIKDGKITEMEIISMGDFTGPPGLYMQIGGKSEMPSPADTTAPEASLGFDE